MVDGYYKCDRCGEFEKGPITRRKMVYGADYSDEEYRKFTFGHRTGDNDNGAKSRTVDLCEDCRKALSAWIDDDA